MYIYIGMCIYIIYYIYNIYNRYNIYIGMDETGIPQIWMINKKNKAKSVVRCGSLSLNF